jgi:apoptosis-inducing factor 2
MAAAHQIVIIGASFGGIPTAHGLLKDIIPKLDSKRAYKVVMISPSDQFFWKIGAPRAIVNPAKLPVDKVLVPIADGFKSYSTDQFEFVKAYATSIDPATKTIQTSASAPVHYDSLVIASGTSFTAPIWSTSGGAEQLAAGIKDIHERLPSAKTVLVAGGGPAGVETAGELGELYGGKKEITIVSGATQLLHKLKNASVGKDAEARLAKMGVKTINDNVKVNAYHTDGGKTTVQLTNGTDMVVDVFIEATGDKPNNQFVPKAWLNERGLVKTDPATLRLDVPDTKGVYCFGSVGSYSNGSVIDTKFALKPLLESIRLDLLGQREPPPPIGRVPVGWTEWLTS